MADQIASVDPVRGKIVQTSEGNLTPPKNIITTVEAARVIYYRYRMEHLKRIELYSRIEGLIAGNPPYNPAELAKHGLSHIANFNNLDARSLYERGALAFWNLLNEAETLISFKIRGDDPLLVRYADVLARNWDAVVRQWPAFYTQVNTLTGQLVKFGLSPLIFPDERDWRWRTIELQRFFVTDQAQSDVEQLTAVCVETTFTVQFLYEVYQALKDAPKEENPWNIDELARFLVQRANSYVKSEFQIFDMMDLQRRLQNGDIGFDGFFSDSVRIISLLYKEYEGGISHYMFDRTFEHADFLYKADRQYQEMQEGVIIFTASPGEFTLHSNRGLGHKIFAGCQAMMQLDCDIVNMARWSSTPLVKSLATGSRDFEAIRFYPGVPTNIGTAEFVPNQLGANIEQLVGASQYLLGKLQYNTANSGDDPGVPDRNVGSVSPSQARMQSFREFGVLKNNIAHFYSQFDLVVRNMVAKMLRSKKGYPGYEQAKEWKDRCIEEGVPKEMFATKDENFWGLPNHLKVSATRVAGDGSTLARIMGLQELAALTGGQFGAYGEREFKRQAVMATVGADQVNAFLPPEEPDESAGGASLAGVENAIMLQGMSPVFSPDNQHRAHIATHMALFNDTIQKLQQQQMSPVDADKIFSVAVPHTGEHIQFIANSPFARAFMQQIEKPWKQIQDYALLNRKNAAAMIKAEIKRQQEQQAEQQRVLNDEELKNLKVQGDERRADFKVQSQVERADRANDTRAEVMKEKVVKDADNQRLKIELEAGNKARAAQPEDKELPELREDLARINGVTPAPFDIER